MVILHCMFTREEKYKQKNFFKLQSEEAKKKKRKNIKKIIIKFLIYF